MRNNGNYKESRRRFSNNFENGDLYVDIKFVNRNYDEDIAGWFSLEFPYI